VRFQPLWDHIEHLREFVGAYCKTRLSPGVAERAILVAQELLENAVKYGDVTGEIELDLRVDETGRRFEIHVHNDAVASRTEILRREIERLEGVDPEAGFEAAMQKSRGNLGMIGLARIRHEGEVDVTLLVDGRRVEVVARGRV
jgi:hypothetical protein